MSARHRQSRDRHAAKNQVTMKPTRPSAVATEPLAQLLGLRATGAALVRLQARFASAVVLVAAPQETSSREAVPLEVVQLQSSEAHDCCAFFERAQNEW